MPNVGIRKLFTVQPDVLNIIDATNKVITTYGNSAIDNNEIIVPVKVAHPLIVAKSVIIPNDTKESLFVCSQPGKIFKYRDNKVSLIADLSFYTGSQNVMPLGAPTGFPVPEYDKRGLLGIEFHKDFKCNNRMFLYFSAADELQPTTKHPTGPPNTPCNECSSETATIKCEWDETKYTHTNVLEEWRYIHGCRNHPDSIRKIRRLLSIKQPFFNHDSLDNLFYLAEEDKLVMFTGDGGFRDAPYLLTQNDNYFHGKAIAIDINSKSWKNYDAAPVARFAELPHNIRHLLEVRIKGIHNWSGMTTMPNPKHSDQLLKIMGQPGQDTTEAVYIMKTLEQPRECECEEVVPRNLGFPGWEGSIPALQNIQCDGVYTDNIGNFKNLTNYQLAISLAIDHEVPYCEYYHNDDRFPGGKGGVVIVGQQPYLSNHIACLSNRLIVADWGLNSLNSGVEFPSGSPSDGGLLWRVPIDNKLNKLHKMERINILYNWKNEFTDSQYPLTNKAFSNDQISRPFFMGLASNIHKTRLYLLTYNRVGSKEINGLGVIYEFIC